MRSLDARWARLLHHVVAGVRGAVDLASIMVGVLVMAIIGGVIAASVVVVIPWAQDSAARSSLDGVKTAQSISQVKDGKYQSWAGLLASKYVTGTPSNVDTIVNPAGDCWVAASKSGSGTAFYTTSRDSTVLDDKAGPPDTSWCVSSTQALANPVTNMVSNPSFESSDAGATITRTNLTPNPKFQSDSSSWYLNWNGNATGAAVWDGATPGALGGNSLAVTPSVNSGGVELTQALPLNSSYMVSFYIKGAASFKGQVFPDGLNMVASGPQLNGWQRYTSPVMTLRGSANMTYVDAFANAGQTFRISNVLVEQTDQLRNYFDGSTTDALGVDYGWAGATGASPSTANTSTVITRSNMLTNPSFEGSTVGWAGPNGSTITPSTAQAFSGTQSNRVTLASSSTGSNNGAGSYPSLTASTTYTFSSYVYVPAASPVVNIQVQAGNGFTTVRGMSSSVKDGWQRISVTFTTDGAQTYAVYVLNDSASTAGQIFYMDAALLEVSPEIGSFFDGSTPNAVDFTYSWTGVPHTSVSVQSAVSSASARINGAANVYRSEARSVSGVSSLGVTAARDGINAGMYFSFPSLPAGTYTFGAKVWLEPGLLFNNGSVGLTALGTGVSGGLNSSTVSTGQWVTLSRTFTVASVTTVNTYVYAGGLSAVALKTFWVDDVQLVRGSSAVPYFDGSSANGVWDGAPHASSSTGYIRR